MNQIMWYQKNHKAKKFVSQNPRKDRNTIIVKEFKLSLSDQHSSATQKIRLKMI